MKQTLKSILPLPLLQSARNTYDAFRRLPQLPDAYLHPWRRESIRRLTELKDIHKGKRAFIVGNGPSLKQTDLTKLKNEFTFGMNRIYLLFPELGFHTTYFCSINDLVIEQFSADILALPMPKFLAWHSHHHFDPNLPIPQVPTFLYTSYTGPRFSSDVRGRVWEGATVTNMALQLAFYMGFEQVILIGVDHNFTSKGRLIRSSFHRGMIPTMFRPIILARESNGSCPTSTLPRSVTPLHAMPIKKRGANYWMRPSAAS
jgi:hypothetical protein